MVFIRRRLAKKRRRLGSFHAPIRAVPYFLTRASSVSTNLLFTQARKIGKSRFSPKRLPKFLDKILGNNLHGKYGKLLNLSLDTPRARTARRGSVRPNWFKFNKFIYRAQPLPNTINGILPTAYFTNLNTTIFNQFKPGYSLSSYLPYFKEQALLAKLINPTPTNRLLTLPSAYWNSSGSTTFTSLVNWPFTQFASVKFSTSKLTSAETLALASLFPLTQLWLFTNRLETRKLQILKTSSKVKGIKRLKRIRKWKALSMINFRRLVKRLNRWERHLFRKKKPYIYTSYSGSKGFINGRFSYSYIPELAFSLRGSYLRKKQPTYTVTIQQFSSRPSSFELNRSLSYVANTTRRALRSPILLKANRNDVSLTLLSTGANKSFYALELERPLKRRAKRRLRKFKRIFKRARRRFLRQLKRFALKKSKLWKHRMRQRRFRKRGTKMFRLRRLIRGLPKRRSLGILTSRLRRVLSRKRALNLGINRHRRSYNKTHKALALPKYFANIHKKKRRRYRPLRFVILSSLNLYLKQRVQRESINFYKPMTPTTPNFLDLGDINRITKTSYTRFSLLAQTLLWSSPSLLSYLLFREKLRTPRGSVFNQHMASINKLAEGYQSQLNTFFFGNRDTYLKSLNIWNVPKVNVFFKKKLIRLTESLLVDANISRLHYITLTRFLEYCTGRKIALHFGPSVNDILTFEDQTYSLIWTSRIKQFQRVLGHKIFAYEGLEVVASSLRLKDPTLLSNWIRGMLNRMSFWKFRLLFRYVKFLIANVFSPNFEKFGFKGFKLRLKGKISVAGNARTRALHINVGETSYATMANRVAYDLSYVGTFTGVLGLKIWFFY